MEQFTMKALESNPRWYKAKKPHWWSIDKGTDRVLLVYWDWDGTRDDERWARFWVLSVASEEVATKIGDVFFQAGMGLSKHPAAREYWPNVPMPELEMVGAE